MTENIGIYFHTEDIDFNFDQPLALSLWLKAVANKENKTIQEVSYIFTSDKALLELNKQHLDHDYYTDVITFPYSSDPIHADIYISIERVIDNANSLDVSKDVELRRVMVHGLLHMCGYSDRSPVEQAQMRKKEDHYLASAPE